MHNDTLLSSYLPLVYKVAKRVARRIPRSVSVDDLVSAGTLGLIDALRRYDPSRAERFPHYAEIRIRGAIIDELRALDWLGRGERARQKRTDVGGSTSTSGGTKTSGGATDGADAAHSHRANAAHNGRLSAIGVLHIDDVSADGFDSVASDDDGPVAVCELNDDLALLATAIESLPPRHQQIISLYYVEELTLKEIGQVLGVSESRVCQLHAQIVSCLREQVVTE